MPQPMTPYRVDVDHGPWAALVGAGPGDPGLLTRRAAELLAAADVVLHDWLSGPAILELVRPGALLVDVGKSKGRGSSQRHIEQLLVAHHGDGARVVRLKGGPRAVVDVDTVRRHRLRHLVAHRHNRRDATFRGR